MKLGEALDKVRETRDERLAGKIADFLRFKKGATYDQIASLAESHGISRADWEQLQYEADRNE